jgi:hypothetical protein
MNEPRTPKGLEPEKRLQLRRRAKRGLVAGYIHELSERHNGGHPRPTLRAAEAIEPARGC